MSLRPVLTAVLVALALTPAELPAQATGWPARLPGPAPIELATAGLAFITAMPGMPAFAPSPAPAAAPSLVPRVAPAAPLPTPMYAPRHRKPGVVLMIVGAGGFVVGHLVNSDVLTVGGAGVALYGLYLYLQ